MCEEETVGFHMKKATITVRSFEPIAGALKIMIRNRIGCVPVLRDGSVEGIVTERTLMKCAGRRSSLNADAGTVAVPAVTISPEETVVSAIEKMRRTHVSYLVVVDEGDQFLGLVSQTDLLEASRRQILEARGRASEIEDMAFHDPVTGLLTRRVLAQALDCEFERARRYGALLGLLFLDIDYFKRVNDEMGHQCGDEVLRRVAEIITECTRKVDYVARYGGDEFVVLLPECGTRTVSILGEHIRERIEREEFVFKYRKLSVTVSGGGCKWTAMMAAPSDMIEEADRCLYEAKRNGKNKIEVSA
jgi:diguanylate cyclase (GGDEF)-like protein